MLQKKSQNIDYQIYKIIFIIKNVTKWQKCIRNF